MDSPFVAEKSTSSVVSLIIDKANLYGLSLIEKLNQPSIVFVSSALPDPSSSVIHIPFGSTVPQIPEGVYSHIFFVWRDEEKELLEVLLKKAEQDSAKIIVIVSGQHVSELLKHVHRVHKQMVIAVVGDIFGKGDSELDEWLTKIKETKQVNLVEMGLTTLYPVGYFDVIDALIQIAYTKTTAATLLLTPHHPITRLSIAHTLQKIDPLIKVDFINGEEGRMGALPEGQKFFHEYHVLEKLQEYYKQIRIKKKENNAFEGKWILQPTPTLQGKKIPLPPKKKRGGLMWLYFVIILSLFPVLVSAASAGLAGILLTSGMKSVEANNLSAGLSQVEAAQTQLRVAKAGLLILSYEAIPFSQQGLVEKAATQVTNDIQITEGLKNGIMALTHFQNVIVGKSLTPQDELSLGVTQAKNALLIFQQVPMESIPQEYQKHFTSLLSAGEQFGNVLDELPHILGKGEKTYLVLLQNNMELRPGGGFIGSYGLATFSNGKFKGFTIHDVYDADGQLKGHVEPPFAIRRYIPLVHLYLRDSNFDVDFAKNAQTAAFMLATETGQKVDGVVGLDLNVVKDLLSTVGSVTVSGYNQTVTADNFFLLTEQHAEKNFFAGSTQKKDFLRSFFTSLQEKLLGQSAQSAAGLLQSVAKGFSEKDLAVAFLDPTIQTPFTVNNLSSSLWDSRTSDSHTVSDFLGINEANLGVNKANYFLDRTLSQQVAIGQDGGVHETATILYSNRSQKGVWPGGVYKNYLRVILPLNTKLDSISVNNKKQTIVPAITDPKAYEAPSFRAPQGLEVDSTTEEGKSLYGFLVTIPEGESMSVAVAYTLSQKIIPDSLTFSYNLQLFKQMGAGEYPYSLDISYPSTYSLIQSSQKVDKRNASAHLATTLATDLPLTFQFAKK